MWSSRLAGLVWGFGAQVGGFEQGGIARASCRAAVACGDGALCTAGETQQLAPPTRLYVAVDNAIGVEVLQALHGLPEVVSGNLEGLGGFPGTGCRVDPAAVLGAVGEGGPSVPGIG